MASKTDTYTTVSHGCNAISLAIGRVSHAAICYLTRGMAYRGGCRELDLSIQHSSQVFAVNVGSGQGNNLHADVGDVEGDDVAVEGAVVGGELGLLRRGKDPDGQQ